MLVAANRTLAGSLSARLTGPGTEVALATEAPAAIARLQDMPDVALLDFEMPGLAGSRAVQLARSLLGDRPLGIVYGRAARGMAQRTLAAGATGVIPDDLDSESLTAALDLLIRGQRFVIFGETDPVVPYDAAASLTDRELQVLHGVCDGLPNKAIAHRFSIREVTVKMHVRAIVRKLGARNRTHAAMIARDLDIV